MDQLTSQDINQLIEALQVWEREPVTNAMQGSMLRILFSGGESDEKSHEVSLAKAKVSAEKLLNKGEQDAKMRREASVLLQAKLLLMRNEGIKRDVSV